MGKKEWSNFSKNLVTIIGNHYVATFLGNTVGTIFSGTYVPGQSLKAFGGEIGGIWDNNYAGNDAETKDKILTGMKGALNVGLNIVGNLAAIYNLGFGTLCSRADRAGFGTAKNVVNDTYGDSTKFEF